MGLYIEIKDEHGKKLAWMEIFREQKLRPGDESGPYSYRFRYNGGRSRGVVGGEGVRHVRTHDAWELVRNILNHSEAEPEYCGLGHCEFREHSHTVIYDDGVAQRIPLYRKVEIGAG